MRRGARQRVALGGTSPSALNIVPALKNMSSAALSQYSRMSTSEKPLLGAPLASDVNRVSVDKRFFHASASASIATGDIHPAPARATFFDEHERYP